MADSINITTEFAVWPVDLVEIAWRVSARPKCMVACTSRTLPYNSYPCYLSFGRSDTYRPCTNS